jgi:CRP-like cAMP-binding protein
MSTMPSRAELKRNLKLLKERLDERPMDLDARMRIARTYRLLHDGKDAVAHYGAVARYLSLAGHPLQAIAVLKELLQVDPRHEETLLFLAKLYARTRAADPSNRGRVAVPIIDGPGDNDAVSPLTDGLPMTATGIWRAIKPQDTAELSVVHNLDDVGAVVDTDPEEVDDDDIDPLDDSLPFEEAVLSQVPLFQSLDAAAFVDLSHSMVLGRAKAGDVIFAEGDSGDSCLVVVNGEATVTRSVDGKAVDRDTLGLGDIAGLFALVRAEARQATLTAHSDVEYFEIDREAMSGLLQKHPAAREALAEVLRDRLVETFLLEMPLASGLSGADKDALRERFILRMLDDGDEVFDALSDLDGLWIVVAGGVDVGDEGADGKVVPRAHAAAGDWILVAPSVSQEPAQVTAQVRGHAAVAALPHVAIKPLLSGPEAMAALAAGGASQRPSSSVTVGTLRR